MPGATAASSKRTSRARDEAGPLSRDAVLDRALDVINQEGVERLTIRRLAEALGVSPMAIYRHVSNKADLVDGVFDLIMSRASVTDHDEDDWLDWLAETFLRMRTALLTQRGALPLTMGRASLGVQALSVMEDVLAVLAKHDIGPPDAARIFNHLMMYTLGSAAILGPIIQQDAELADPGERTRRIRANFELLSGKQFPQLTQHASELAQSLRDTAFSDEIRHIVMSASVERLKP
ncbi:MAG: TetR/AcrR family transcriptional regulator C-terminal domain-containing protein [Myxococcota bacterium]|jgi:AcrR family transcriptional regulator|nr:TetR/AcrR family transcriptional regulator C-terminal domain-containing protein [Myxococcota bacterium]